MRVNNEIKTNNFEKQLLQSRLINNNKEDDNQLEFIREIKGVAFINDSKSTRLSSTKYSLERLNAPTILIMGGNDTGYDYSVISRFVKDRVVAIIYMGNEKEQLLKLYGEQKLMFTEATSVTEAVKIASLYGQVGDAVLLSPGSECINKLPNELGNEFKKAVIELKI